MISWKEPILRNAYAFNREGTFNGHGVEGHWKEERPDLTYEDYWIFFMLVGHKNYHRYLSAHVEDIQIMSEPTPSLKSMLEKEKL